MDDSDERGDSVCLEKSPSVDERGLILDELLFMKLLWCAEKYKQLTVYVS